LSMGRWPRSDGWLDGELDGELLALGVEAGERREAVPANASRGLHTWQPGSRSYIKLGRTRSYNFFPQSWGPLLGKLFFAFWVLLHLYPFLKGVMGKQERVPALVVVLSVVPAAIFFLLWVRVNHFTQPCSTGLWFRMPVKIEKC
jgi:hypothetical protein